MADSSDGAELGLGARQVASVRLPRQIILILAKDLRLEWRGKGRFFSVALFGFVVVTLFSFSLGPDSEALRGGAAGFLVLALFLSSTLNLAESFRQEREQEGITGLLLLPAQPAAVFYGKALANALLLIGLGPLLIPAALVLYSVPLGPWGILRLFGFWTLASAGLAAPGTLYAAMTSQLQSRDVLLPLLLFPLMVPVLLGSVKAIQLVLGGDAMGQLGAWAWLLVAFVFIYWCLGGVLMTFVLEET
jgi:heme exporter protein B